MLFKLIKTPTFVHTCEIQQVDESGKTVLSKLRTRFNRYTREAWDELTKANSDDDRLLYDVLVNKFEDKIQDDAGNELADEDAVKLIRTDLSVTGQIVDQAIDVMFGAAAKNSRRSRGR